MGAEKLLHEISADLQKAGISMGRDRFFNLLRERALLVSVKKRFTRTTYHDESLPVFRNLLYDHKPNSPDQVWVSDITYIATEQGFAYLSLITDLYSRKIVGWNLAKSF